MHVGRAGDRAVVFGDRFGQRHIHKPASGDSVTGGRSREVTVYDGDGGAALVSIRDMTEDVIVVVVRFAGVGVRVEVGVRLCFRLGQRRGRGRHGRGDAARLGPCRADA